MSTPHGGPQAFAGVVIPAAGRGTRLGAGDHKAFVPLRGHPLLWYTLRPFLELREIRDVVVVLCPGDEKRLAEVLPAPPPAWLQVQAVAGGETRSESVWNGLEAMTSPVEVVAVHDGARPLIEVALIQRLLRVARQGEGVVPGLPYGDTVKRVRGGRAMETLPREDLWQIQTPQAFPRSLLTEAYRRARARGVKAPDDAALVEAIGCPVRVLEGSPFNLKITTPSDLQLAEAILAWREGETGASPC